MASYKQPVSVLVVIHTPALDILLLERTGHPGYWQSVTGSREGNEPLLETAYREVAEETGIAPGIGILSDWQQANQYEIFPEWRHRYAPGITRNTEHVFSLELPATRPIVLAPREHRASQWLNWSAAADLCFSESNQAAIRDLARRQKAPQA